MQREKKKQWTETERESITIIRSRCCASFTHDIASSLRTKNETPRYFPASFLPATNPLNIVIVFLEKNNFHASSIGYISKSTINKDLIFRRNYLFLQKSILYNLWALHLTSLWSAPLSVWNRESLAIFVKFNLQFRIYYLLCRRLQIT